MIRRLSLNLLAVLTGAILSLVLLEGALRIYNPIVQTVKGDRVVLRVNYDETRRNTHIPGIASEIHIHQNSLGFRGADPPADLADRLSIITIGGSTTRSATESDNHTWTDLLGDAVANCFDRIWINNAGFDGHTSFAHLQLVRNYIAKLHPKIVILLIGANELYADGAINGPNAFDREQMVMDLNFEAGIKGFFMGLSNRSELVELSLTLYRSFRAWRVGLSWANSDWTNLPEGEAMPADGASKLAAARDMQPAYAERLRHLIDLLRDGGTKPVFMTQPTVTGIARDPTTGKDLSRLDDGLFWYKSLEIFNDTMRQVASAENTYLIDLEHAMPKDTKYYWDPIHYTDAGASKVAEIAAGALLPFLEQKFPSYSKDKCEMGSAPTPS
jgi:lysophospholipase L1-like esterase